ncbi:MAG: hypothetical protein VYE73_15505 [Acidobacteriota bacterium]|nr:hypothetical protein [Acidobacteriota bacterium]
MSASKTPWRAFAFVCLVAWTLAPRLSLAQIEPKQRKSSDERYTMRNVAYLMTEGPARIDNDFYPGLSFALHLPVLIGSEWLAQRFGAERFRVVRLKTGPRMSRVGAADGLDFTAYGYRAARRINVVFGLASVALCFVIARRWVPEPWDSRWRRSTAPSQRACPLLSRPLSLLEPTLVLSPREPRSERQPVAFRHARQSPETGPLAVLRGHFAPRERGDSVRW